MRVLPDNTIALIVDYQTKLVPAMSDISRLIHNSSILLKGLGVLGIPSIITQQYTRGLGETVPEILEAAEDCPIFDKITFSCYQDDEIRQALRSSGRKNVIVCGIESHVCVLQTVIDLLGDGYNVFLVEDCIDSRKPSDKASALIRAQQEGAFITSYEAILFELTHIAGTERFKQISRLVK